MLSATVAKVITVNRSNNHIAQIHFCNGFSQLLRLFCIRRKGFTVGYVTERTTTGTNITKNHKGGCTVVETLGKVRTACFFTNRVKVVFAKCLFDVINFLGSTRKLDFNPLRLAQHFFLFSRNNSDGNVFYFFIITEFYPRLRSCITHQNLLCMLAVQWKALLATNALIHYQRFQA